ncbi:MAG: type I-C CRISPR-associated protein Cas8c/Csd1 [Tannerellaceae bacterium]
MILNALYDYYQRKSADPESGIAPLGFEWKEIPFIIVIDKKGNFKYIEDTRDLGDKKKRAKSFLVLKSVGRPGKNSWQTAFSLWDHYGYVLAHPKDESKSAKESALQQQGTFIKRVEELASRYPSNQEIEAVRLFYQSQENIDSLFATDLWAECKKKPGVNMSFRIVGTDLLVAEHPDLAMEVQSEEDGQEGESLMGRCLITGKYDKIATLHTAISLVGAKSGAKLVGFQKNSGYDSYKKEQGANAPISVSAEAAYTTALNTLLSKDSKNKLRVSQSTFVFWSEKEDLLEDVFASFFESESKDNPDKNIEEIRSFLNSYRTGVYNTQSDTEFYVLGLAPNSARISVTYFWKGKISGIASNIAQHFNDLMIVRRSESDREYVPLFYLLTSIATQNKIDNLPPNLIVSMSQSIIQGTMYPAQLQNLCINRIRADRKINYARASILKAYINRKNRILNLTKEREITMALDLENKNQGYLLGRLFAVLENIQSQAIQGLNATIKDRYYGAASTTPVTVFGRLLDLSNHHLGKLPGGSKVYFEKKLQDIIDGISSSGMPSHLNLDDQSRFAIGYYHQRKELFTSNKENVTETNN